MTRPAQPVQQIPDRYLVDCPKVQAAGAETGDLLDALRQQHEAVDNCNDRLRKARQPNHAAEPED